MAVQPSLLNLAKQSGVTNLCPNVTGVLDSSYGSSVVEAHKCLWNPPLSIYTGSNNNVVSTVSNTGCSNLFPINNNCNYSLGCGCGGYGYGSWTGMISDINNTSWWDNFHAAIGQSFFMNPLGTLSSIFNVGGSIGNVVGNVLSKIANWANG